MKQALVVIDVQNGITRNKSMHPGWPGILENIEASIRRARAAGVPVIFVQQDSPKGDLLEPGSPAWELDAGLGRLPGEPVVHKTACDAFFDTPLEQMLRAQGVDHLVVAGCMTEFCVDTSIRCAVSLGFDVTLVGDGHATWDARDFTAAQIVAHHNRIFHWFDAGPARTWVRKADDIEWSAA